MIITFLTWLSGVSVSKRQLPVRAMHEAWSVHSRCIPGALVLKLKAALGWNVIQVFVPLDVHDQVASAVYGERFIASNLLQVVKRERAKKGAS